MRKRAQRACLPLLIGFAQAVKSKGTWPGAKRREWGHPILFLPQFREEAFRGSTVQIEKGARKGQRESIAVGTGESPPAAKKVPRGQIPQEANPEGLGKSPPVPYGLNRRARKGQRTFLT